MGVLHTAIDDNNYEQLKSSLECGISPEEKNSQGYPALQHLLTKSTINLEMIKLLIEHGANKNTRQPETGYTLLHIALSKREADFLDYALSIGVNVLITNYRQEAPFDMLITAFPNRLDLVKRFINLGVNSSQCLSFLYAALAKGDEKEILEVLDLVSSIPNISVQRLVYQSPMEWVINHYPEKRAVIEAMIKKGADKNTVNKTGQNLLHLAMCLVVTLSALPGRLNLA